MRIPYLLQYGARTLDMCLPFSIAYAIERQPRAIVVDTGFLSNSGFLWW